jgi:hypothetical protein
VNLSSIKQKSDKLIWLIRRRYAARREGRIEGQLLFDWEHIEFTRTDVIQAILKEYPCRSYLEIGCQGDKNFKAISAPLKIGVDPVSGGTHRMTSDAFFAENHERFDCIFIDGLHTYEQVRKDVENSLRCLDRGGVLFIHDMLPASWERERVPRLNPIWNGTVWKIAYELLERFGSSFGIVMANHGVGVVFKDIDAYADFSEQQFEKIRSLGFDDFKRDRESFHLVSVDKLPAFIESRKFPS